MKKRLAKNIARKKVRQCVNVDMTIKNQESKFRAKYLSLKKKDLTKSIKSLSIPSNFSGSPSRPVQMDIGKMKPLHFDQRRTKEVDRTESDNETLSIELKKIESKLKSSDWDSSSSDGIIEDSEPDTTYEPGKFSLPKRFSQLITDRSSQRESQKTASRGDISSDDDRNDFWFDVLSVASTTQRSSTSQKK